MSSALRLGRTTSCLKRVVFPAQPKLPFTFNRTAFVRARPSPLPLLRRFSSSVPARDNAETVVDAQIVEKDEKLNKPVVEAETVVGKAESFQYQAETRKLLDIVARSLYTDKEVFVRELISNASDALEKLRHMRVTGSSVADDYLNTEISITTDETANTITIQDTGVGMSKQELIQNLGTIAHSGTAEFLKKMQKSDKNLIGQFGVGFYSVFVVGDTVKVFTRSYQADSKGYAWTSDGTGTYEIAEAENVSRGTKIVIHLKKDCANFSRAQAIENIVKKYSNFVGFDIKLNGQKVNTIKALWTLGKSEVSEEDHRKFYQFISHSTDEPLFCLHYATDSPIDIKCLFYIPAAHTEKFGMGRMQPSVSLFSRRVLIQSKAKGLLPEWLRFIRGVVDSEDIPLNLSREHLQDSALIQRLSTVLTRRLLRFLHEQASADPAKYLTFWKEYAGFLKEGVCTDLKAKEEVGKLLRYSSSRNESDEELTSFEEYIKRMPETQKEIFFLVSPNRELAKISPYYESYKALDVEVLFLYSQLDEFVMGNLAEFEGKKLVNIESAPAPEAPKTDQQKEKDTKQSLSADEFKDFSSWMRNALFTKVSLVKETSRLISAPAIITEHESAAVRRMMQMMDPTQQGKLPKQVLEVNSSHPIITKTNTLRKSNPAAATKIAEQVFDNALMAAGLMDDPRGMIPRLNSILELALSNTSTTEPSKEQ